MIQEIDVPDDATPKQKFAIERRAGEVVGREQGILKVEPERIVPIGNADVLPAPNDVDPNDIERRINNADNV